MTTLTTTAPVIDATGIHVPAYADVLTFLQTQFQAIYGSDVYLGNDSQDGQLLGIFAAAINDANSAAVAVYNSFSPATAQGNALSSNVKLNGIARSLGSNSTCNVAIVGVAGTTITNGVVTDSQNNRWNLPASVVIPPAGTITVTATCATAGSITAGVNTLTGIATPTLGWQSVTNPGAASPGTIVETDAALRQRQGTSVALPSLTVLAGIVGAVLAVSGVLQVAAYENDTATTDARGIPRNSIALVVQGGNALAIATAISQKKTPGAFTYGTTSQSVVDSVGVPHTISFFTPTLVPIAVAISLHALTGYTSAIAAEIQAAVSAYINALAIGQSVLLTRLYTPANLSGGADGNTFEIVTLTINGGSADVAIAFNQLATCTPASVTITVL